MSDMKPFRPEFGGVHAQVWSRNNFTFDTVEEATAYARGLLGRWMGADIARVVPSDTPERQPIDLADPTIVVNFRTEGVA